MGLIREPKFMIQPHFLSSQATFWCCLKATFRDGSVIVVIISVKNITAVWHYFCNFAVENKTIKL